MAQHYKNDDWHRFLTWKYISRLLVALVGLMIAWELVTFAQIYQEKVQVEKQLEVLKEQNAKLEAEKEELSDPKTIEQVARKELGLVKPGEMPYVK